MWANEIAYFYIFFLLFLDVPNAGNKLVTLPKRLQWNEDFKKHILDLDKKKPVIVCGDMNVAHQEIGKLYLFSVSKKYNVYTHKYLLFFASNRLEESQDKHQKRRIHQRGARWNDRISQFWLCRFIQDALSRQN